MFGDPIKNEKSFQSKTIEAVCKEIYGGGTPSKLHPEYYEGNIPWVSPKDMKYNVIKDSQDHITKEAVSNSSAKMVPANSVVMVIRSGILKHTLPVAINVIPITVNQDLKVLIPGDLVTSHFLATQFKMIEKDVLAGVRAVTADNIDFNCFRRRKIIVPPLSIQKEFDKIVHQINKSKFVIQKTLFKSKSLMESSMR